MQQHDLHICDLPGVAVHHILAALGPRDLARASATCQLWREHGADALTDRMWSSHFAERWRTERITTSWRQTYGQKMQQLRSYHGRFQQDRLTGHSSTVRTLCLLPALNLLATGSADRTVRLWDLSAGLPLASSRRLGGLVRSLAVDDTDDPMLVAGTSQDHAVRVWRGSSGSASSSSTAPCFNLAKPKKLGRKHTGPVSAVALSKTCIFSGSWDYSVRIWDRDSLECQALLSFPEWVDCLAPRGSNLLVAAGAHIYIHDLESARRTRQISCPNGSVDASSRLSLEGRRDSQLVFAGGANGQVVAFDLRAANSKPVALLSHHREAVSSLSLEDPWLAAAHGAVSLIDVDDVMRFRLPHSSKSKVQPPPTTHTRQLPTASSVLHCVDIRDEWLAAGNRNGVVQTFDFTQAAAAEQRSQAARQDRRAARRARIASNNWRASAHAAEPHQQASTPVAPGAAPPVAQSVPSAAAFCEQQNSAAPAQATRGDPDGSEAGTQPDHSAVAEPLEPVTDATARAAEDGDAEDEHAAAGSSAASWRSEQQDRASRMPRWRIIRPCKYRTMELDGISDEVEVNG